MDAEIAKRPEGITTKMTCCFTGHRDIPSNKVNYIKNELRREIGEAIAAGYEHFISGFADGVDLLSAEIVLELKKEWPSLTLEAAIPFPKRLETLFEREDAAQLLRGCIGIGVWSDQYFPNAYMVRNRKMLSLSTRMIAIYDGREKGGTVQIMRLANTMGVQARIIKI